MIRQTNKIKIFLFLNSNITALNLLMTDDPVDDGVNIDEGDDLLLSDLRHQTALKTLVNSVNLRAYSWH